jgi:serine/threonine-protein kinase
MTGQTISHYTVLDKLGQGGMGVVYQARDTRLDRLVALKFLPPERVADPERKARFIREARAASALNHPNIITIYDIASEAGQDFIVMEYVPGQTLSQLISSKGLPPKEAIKYAVQIADALAAAHAKGIIHRDLKPGNVMVTGPEGSGHPGLVKVLDFGLAKLTEPSGPGESTATAVVGTVAYMSPEQAEGIKVDARSDIFSFGAVLYEMLAGRRAFSGLMRGEPAPLLDVPPELDHLVARCLRKNPNDRFQRATDLKQALEESARALERPASLPSIAVLPFANLSADKENEYFSDGLAEDIIDALTQVPGLQVMARTSAFAFRGKEVDISEIGAKLKVGHILEGSVRKAGNRIRVTAQLVKVSDGYHLWSQRFDREMTDVFAIQDEISQAIVEKLRVRLAGDRPLVKRHTQNVEAYNLLLRGRHCVLRGTAEAVAKGREYLEQAIALDPDYALAYAGMAEYYWTSAFWGFRDPKQLLPKAKSAAMEAVGRDDTLAEGHALSGILRGTGDFDWVGAEQEFRRALELNPASPMVRHNYGFFFLRSMGRLDEALSEVRRAVDLDPLSAMYNTCLAYLHYARGQYDLAIAQQRRAMDLDPGWYVPHWLLAIQYEHMRMFEEAIASARKACELSGRNAVTVGILALGYGLAGRPSEARALLEELTTLRRTTYVPPFAMAAVYRGLGEANQALEWLEKGVEERDPIVVTGLRSEPRYIPFYGHPRYHALLHKMNLEP